MFQRLKSKTYWLNISIMLLGVLVAQFDSVKEYFGDHQGLAFIVISVAGMALRELTTKPVSKK